jgi:hypothetical protein
LRFPQLIRRARQGKKSQLRGNLEMPIFERGQSVRMQLLTTASMVALAAAGTSSTALADTFSVDIGGSWLQTHHDNTDYLNPDFPNSSEPTVFDVAPGNGFEANGTVSWRPDDSDLIFSAGLTYGRTHDHHASRYGSFSEEFSNKYFGGNASNKVSHTLIDFQVGRDFGIGMFGENGSSVLSIGARYAKFSDRTHVAFQSSKYLPEEGGPHTFGGAGRINRGFTGLGPRLSWEASLPLGDQTTGGFTVDWGVDFAILFGRSTASDHFSNYARTIGTTTYSTNNGHRNHDHIVPNFDAHLGMSYHFDGGAHVSFGYMFEKFGNVLDGGAPEAPEGDGFYNYRQTDRISYGPYVKLGYDFGG